MGVMGTCNRCGHGQMLGYNAVDGRVKWWTRCEACGKGNFIVLPKMPRVRSPEEPPTSGGDRG